MGNSEGGKGIVGIVGNCPGVNSLLLYVIQKMGFSDRSKILQLAHLNILPDLLTRPLNLFCDYSHLHHVAAFAHHVMSPPYINTQYVSLSNFYDDLRSIVIVGSTVIPCPLHIWALFS